MTRRITNQRQRRLVSNTCYRDLLVAREVLGDCYRHPVLLEDAAMSIHLSPFHFQREFRRAFGETPHEFVTRLRMDQAKELLAQTNLSVIDICLQVGFNSLGSFSSLFKRRVGISPGAYRRQLRPLVRVSGVRDLVCIPFCFARALSFGS